MDIIRKGSLPKLREKLLEALQAVLPIVAIVLVLCFSIAPVSPSILLCFLLGAAMIIVGIMMFQLKQKKKLAGTLIVAFGLFCIVAAIMEILSAMGKTF